jgi:hypothetical protein
MRLRPTDAQENSSANPAAARTPRSPVSVPLSPMSTWPAAIAASRLKSGGLSAALRCGLRLLRRRRLRLTSLLSSTLLRGRALRPVEAIGIRQRRTSAPGCSRVVVGRPWCRSIDGRVGPHSPAVRLVAADQSHHRAHHEQFFFHSHSLVRYSSCFTKCTHNTKRVGPSDNIGETLPSGG